MSYRYPAVSSNPAVVKFRDHPLMTRKSGRRSWPPLWTTTRRDVCDKPRGEVGTLESILTQEPIENLIFLWMKHNGARYMGAMAFDDVAFCREVCAVLKLHLGTSIKDIGNIDLSYTC